MHVGYINSVAELKLMGSDFSFGTQLGGLPANKNRIKSMFKNCCCNQNTNTNVLSCFFQLTDNLDK